MAHTLKYVTKDDGELQIPLPLISPVTEFPGSATMARFYEALGIKLTAFCMLKLAFYKLGLSSQFLKPFFTKEAFCKLDSILRNVCFTTGR